MDFDESTDDAAGMIVGFGLFVAILCCLALILIIDKIAQATFT